MKKLLKSRKALSPVVAAIILIAVTVAVSIAVAAWMGALTFTFMRTEELKITGMSFQGTSGVANNTIVLTVKNPGTGKVSVGEIRINDVPKSFTGLPDFAPGDQHNLTVNMEDTPWVSGNRYKATLMSAAGTPVGAYEETA